MFAINLQIGRKGLFSRAEKAVDGPGAAQAATLWVPVQDVCERAASIYLYKVGLEIPSILQIALTVCCLAS